MFRRWRWRCLLCNLSGFSRDPLRASIEHYQQYHDTPTPGASP